jgi:hypothetical protein
VLLLFAPSCESALQLLQQVLTTPMLPQLLVSISLYTGGAQYSGWRILASRARVSLRARVILLELSECSVAGAAMQQLV